MLRTLTNLLLLPLLTLVTGLCASFADTASRGFGEKTKVSSDVLKGIRIYSGYYALVVGCGNYTNGWPKLPNAVKDASEVADLLRGMGWEVTLLKNPGGVSLRKALNYMTYGPGRDPERAILFWFSGHGHTEQKADGYRLGYIVPVDAPDPKKDPGKFIDCAIDMRQIETYSERIYAKHVLMLFDSCFSGSVFFVSRARPPKIIEIQASRPVRQFITAGTEEQEVPDQSMFKRCFIQGLRERDADLNRDEYITGQEMGLFLQTEVANAVVGQTPQFGKIRNPALNKGDFIFKLRRPTKTSVTDSEDRPASLLSRSGLDQDSVSSPIKRASANTGQGHEGILRKRYGSPIKKSVGIQISGEKLVHAKKSSRYVAERPDSMTKESRPRIAVLYFRNNSPDKKTLTPLSKGLAAMIISDLQLTGKYDLVERENIEQLFREMELSTRKYFDSNTIAQVGKLVGAQYIVFGSFMEVLGKFRMDARMVSVDQGIAVATSGVSGKAENFDTLQQQLVLQLVARHTQESETSNQELLTGLKKRNLRISDILALGKALEALDKDDRGRAYQLLNKLLERNSGFIQAKEVLATLQNDKEVSEKNASRK